MGRPGGARRRARRLRDPYVIIDRMLYFESVGLSLWVQCLVCGTAAPRQDPKYDLCEQHCLRLRKAIKNWTYKRKLKLSIFASQKGHCVLCGEKLGFRTASLDHIVPLRRGGSLHKKNIQLVHLSCNNRKGGDLQEDLDWTVEQSNH